MWHSEVNMDQIVFTDHYYGKRFKASAWIFPGKYHYLYPVMLNYINFHLIFFLRYLLSESWLFFIH